MTNWRTNLGGAVSVTGTTLIGVGLLTQLSQLSPNTANVLTPHQLAAMWYVALTGFVLSAIGKGLTALFAADAKNTAQNQIDIENLKSAIRTGNTDIINKTETPKA